MSTGNTIGFANQISQGGIDGSLDVPTHRDFLGDLTQRMHVMKPVPSEPQATIYGPETGLSVDDSAGVSGNVYMVRAVVQETTPSGTYFNASQGAFSAPVP